MAVQQTVEVLYLAIVGTLIAFVIVFYLRARRAPKAPVEEPAPAPAEGAPPAPMERKERGWLYFLLAIVVLANLVTLSPLIPSTEQGLWDQTPPAKVVTIHVENYTFNLTENPIRVPLRAVVEFVLISHDVTYGFGVFTDDGLMVFQMSVIPGYTNHIRWVFDTPGLYDIRSTEYSGPRHPTMHLPDAIEVA